MRTWTALLMLSLAACGGDETPPGSNGSDGSDGVTDGTDGTDGDDTEPQPVSGMPNGTFLLQFTLAPVGGLLLPFQAEVATLEDADGALTFTAALQATDAEGAATSEVLLEVSSPVAADGSWSADAQTFVLPGAFSPTGSDVEVSMAFAGSLDGEAFFCGEVTGEIVTFGMDLAGSTFGAVPWDERDGPPRGSCDAPSDGFDPIADCPTLAAGVNTAFPSAGEDRRFELVVPSDYTPDRDWPVVFVFHGLGGSIADMLDGDSLLRAQADARGVLLVAPQGLDFGGSPGWDAVNGEANNRDLQLFDDLLTCVSEQYAVDPTRVLATGLSNGGLFTGALLAHKSDTLAAVAPISGGVITAWPDDADKVPMLVTWGGEADEAYDQDFHQLSLDLIAEGSARGHFLAACDHGTGHELESGWWPWVLEFLLAHPQGLTGSPFASGLPESFPDYCWLPE